MSKKYVIHVISNTHWDREWLNNFQETRMMLVEFFDLLLEVMEGDDSYTSYVLDSQTVPLEDYLEFRPENRERLAALIEAERLLVGPWYTCPEGFEVNGESLVRNLLMGHRVASGFGHVMKVGHTPFSYGQNSQMPQIYSGFGIDTMLFYHGVSHQEVSNEWIFEGADGTRILGSQMSSGARYNFYHGVYRPAVIGRTVAEREHEWKEGGMPFHRASPELSLTHHLLLQPRRTIDKTRLEQAVRALKEAETGVSVTRHLCFMMGHDSSVPDPLEPELIRLTREALPDDEVVHSNYESMLRAVREEIDWNKLTVLKGERRVPKPMPIILHLYSDVLSSRTRMKKRSSRAEYKLQRTVEPFLMAAALMGAPWPAAMLEYAWKTMLRCHAHDSISGSGVDAIEEDMMNRLRQVLDLSDSLGSRALAHMQEQIDTSALPSDAVVLTVYNPAPRERSEVVTAVVDLPWQGPRPRGQFTLRDAESGKAIPVQCAARKPHWAVMNHAFDAPNLMKSERFTIHFEATQLPGLGYATFVADLSGSFDTGTLVTAANTLENEHLRAEIRPDGTITLLDKHTGVSYPDLHYFVDDGEGGHAWMHVRPAYDRPVDSRGFPVVISLEEDGPLLARYRIEYRMSVPSGIDDNGGDPWQRLDGVGNHASRGTMEEEMTIVSRITLRRNSRSLEVQTSFDNRAQCHRLRVMLPTHRKGKYCHAESAFDVVERETAFDENSVWHGAKGVTFPMQRFADVSDGTAGIAFISESLREYEVTDTEDRAIAVTLLRAYEINLATVSCRWETHPEMILSQSPGHHEFTYRIHPHAGNYAEGAVLEEADDLVAPLEPVQAGVCKGRAPLRQGFLTVSPASLLLSAVKQAEDGAGWVIRLFNPTERTIEGSVTPPPSVTGAALLTLEEKRQETLSLEAGQLHLSVAPKKIVTLLLEN
ncbi:MAG TPA: glycoside hydrolase family 38 C-terminal domain-containing protein [Candidatus Hydrogenedentes bacterium]|jgi:alpha-mannosidase|nr:glycoside hydrolase family 38 C-terminal domain-containing protein [Candidatus Hydrogenedentota bacterium]HOD95183.1 glycoside hydrolase family 38 C-terminal domain-containing protein [Candidatus Hydrogenedentota bacterium]HOR50530.1 glycoside hydrolase family 38 C-terminal domain-containing protein [Candidatus Hydrogenedentota bacterium]HPK24507.1 glycoside hydrolase family 38 C-terminal domain-containing protein [Candidatus Hydrogenedentota bacterium]HPX86157.1 glycoside hydrolase family 3